MRYICLILLVFLFASCANEKRFVKFHDKEEGKAAGHCATWYPVKEKVVDGPTTYAKGEEIYLPAQTELISVDCDSIQKAIAGHGKKSKNIVYVKVPVKGRVDTIKKDVIHYVENTAYQVFLQDSIRILHGQISKDRGELQKKSDELSGVKKTRNKLWGAIGLLIIFTGWREYTRLKKSYKR